MVLKSLNVLEFALLPLKALRTYILWCVYGLVILKSAGIHPPPIQGLKNMLSGWRHGLEIIESARIFPLPMQCFRNTFYWGRYAALQSLKVLEFNFPFEIFKREKEN